jgi:hypothetical protein
MKPAIIGALQEQLAIIEPVDVRAWQTWWRIFSFDEKTGEIRKMVAQKNTIPYEGADVMARVLAGDVTYAPAAMFFEFENTAGSPVIPTAARDEGIDYYLSTLASESTKDYLRVPLIVSPSFTSSGAAYAGNQVTFFAVTSGMQGIHGKTFDHTVDSQVYGVALAATPTPDQYTLDKLFSRSYSGFDPVPKEDGYQIGAQYLIRFR